MAEKRLIDANALLEQDVYYDTAKCLIPRYEIERAPTVDAVEVIRCKDCKNQVAMWCWRKQEDHTPFRVGSDDFCSYGERRTDG